MKKKFLKLKLRAIWMIIKADGFSSAVTYPTSGGIMFDSVSCFGSDTTGASFHYKIGVCFNRIGKDIEKRNEEFKNETSR